MHKITIGIYNFIGKHKVLSILLLLAVIALSVYSGLRLQFSEDISRILPDSKKISNMTFVYENSKLMDKVVFTIGFNDTSTIDPEELSNAAKILVDSITSKFIPDLVQKVNLAPSNQDMLEVYSFASENIPALFDDEDFQKLDEIFTKNNIEKAIKSNYSTLLSPASFATKKMISSDPFHLTPIVLEKFKELNTDNDFQTYNNFFITSDKKNLVFLITPASTNNTSLNTKLFSSIDEIINHIESSYNNKIRIDYFGNAVVALGNANRIKDDIIITVSIAIILLLVFISIFFRSRRTFIIVFLPVVFGALVALAFITIIKGEISAISLGIGAVLLGICVDFSLHIYSHFRENGSVKLVLKNLTTPIILSSLTTASAFLSLYFINSEALNDLGLFAAISIIAAALFSLIVLPHLLGKPIEKGNNKQTIIDKIAAYPLSRNKYIKLSVVLITIVLFFFSKKVSFDADMMKNNYMSEELQNTEQRINSITSVSKKTIYIVSSGRTIEEAKHNNTNTTKIINDLKLKHVIDGAAVLNNVIPSIDEQNKAIKKWNDYWSTRYDSVEIWLNNASSKTGFRDGAFSSFLQFIVEDHKPIESGKSQIINELFLDNFIIETDSLSAIINVLKVDNTNNDINQVYNAFNDIDNVWIIDKRLITSEFVTILQNNLNKLVIISLTLVFIILLLAYGRIELTIITMVPIIISWIWTVGIMGILGIDFNIFNVIILTFIFGLGIDYSIFIMRGLLLNYKLGTEGIQSYKISVILSGITTLVGIGVLIFAKHPALRSIATMSIIGILSVILVTFTLLPAIFRWLVYYKKGMRRRPITFLDFLFSLWALFVFITGSIFQSILSLLMIIVPIKKAKKKEIIHRLFRYLTWFMIYMNFMSRKVIINPLNEDYRKPAIIIANHQSHIDLMLMMLLNWRVVVLTNIDNFRNPMYGPALKYAGFIEVGGDFESIFDQVKKQTDEGYSVVVYPEGHRSEGDKLLRFHKGAFILASELNLEILPIVIYGQKEALKKSEFFLKRAAVITKFLPRIDLSKGEFGETPREHAKNVKRYFEKEYFEVARMLDVPDYFNDFVKKNFIYKGPVLEWYTRIKLQLEDNYNFFNDLIPEKGIITDLGCGYGYLAFMLNLVSKERTILGYDYDEDKIATANNCAIKRKNVNFFLGDITNIDLQQSDVFILNDVLHYLPEKMQIDVISNCISNLNTNGMIIIRDADKDMKKRHLGTRITEILSTNIGFNKTKYKLDFISSNPSLSSF
jgi:1-acyl-sn-glycerol-3-phosphate acyltransferase